MKILKYFSLIFFLLLLITYFGVKDSFTPFERISINNPIFTIGDKNYQKALDEGKSVVKFKDMFWGLYPGGLAFKSVKEAKEYLKKNQETFDKFSSSWAIYELLGDYKLDTKVVKNQRYINKSLFIKKLAEDSN